MGRPRRPGTLEGMLTQTAENPVATEQTAAAPVVLTAVTKRYGRRRGAVAALDQVSLSFGAVTNRSPLIASEIPLFAACLAISPHSSGQ